MKKFDKFIYYTIYVIGIITIFILSYTILGILLLYLNPIVLAIDLVILLIMVYLIKPYMLLVGIVGITYIIRLIKYKEKKCKQIFKMLLFVIIILFTMIAGIKLFPLTGRYEVKINKYVSQIENGSIRGYLEENNIGDHFVYKIKIIQGFPDDYNAKIYYNNMGIKTKNDFLSDNASDFIIANFKDVTTEDYFKSLILLILSDYFMIKLLKLSGRFYKKISTTEVKVWNLNYLKYKQVLF